MYNVELKNYDSDRIANNLVPAELCTPGDELQDMLDDRDMSQAELARQMGKKRSYVNEIIKGRHKITPELSIQLGSALGINIDYFLRAQYDYDLTELRLRYQELIEAQAQHASSTAISSTVVADRTA